MNNPAFDDLLADVREGLAQRHLPQGTVSASEVAHLVGSARPQPFQSLQAVDGRDAAGISAIGITKAPIGIRKASRGIRKAPRGIRKAPRGPRPGVRPISRRGRKTPTFLLTLAALRLPSRSLHAAYLER